VTMKGFSLKVIRMGKIVRVGGCFKGFATAGRVQASVS
jgi:hypothetical protein